MSSTRILIVEDEVLLAADLADNLKNMGFEVVGMAHTGESAIEQAREKVPDLVLMDIQLRGNMDGIEAATQIREDPGCAIIFQSAYAENPMLDRATTAEPFGYLVKPVGWRELRATIQMALYKARMEAEQAELNRKLQKALDEVKTLREFLPICAWCKKVRDDEGYWKDLEDYLSQHTGTHVSHGICPSCLEKMESEYSDQEIL